MDLFSNSGKTERVPSGLTMVTITTMKMLLITTMMLMTIIMAVAITDAAADVVS